ncbi:hypothetical protein VB151_03150 [Xanthomonas fragariae]|uniref:Arsenate reductase n=1 Tax=Xanthomonas fragariae TaxID=48664 RepID=A0A1Y6HFZ8_9XANT|nr:ArsC/Spx/MgsR family protein [Xanthomonas fragariae]ENZ94377.1 arsenate reductase [Xanthomonas fragariae LMG 25863]MEA5174489.1 hypothetical protein [Xanthomonas fragariae]MEA5185686.1 hypothetical protein [Xanthomonas fragariae]MEA5197681.1 hypothetical protein [Xanthomonas fragariae]MEA5209977.1 hypothetical protein [Xanthomonas fragariae]
MHAVIYHNPACGTSRNTLALIRHVGIEPHIIDYLQHPPTRQTLQALIAAACISVRDAIRQKGTPYVELGLDDPALDDASLLSAWSTRAGRHRAACRRLRFPPGRSAVFWLIAPTQPCYLR